MALRTKLLPTRPVSLAPTVQPPSPNAAAILKTYAPYMDMAPLSDLAMRLAHRDAGLTIEHPAHIEDNASGRTIANLGERGRNETVTIQPNGSPASAIKGSTPGYAAGGTITVDPLTNTSSSGFGNTGSTSATFTPDPWGGGSTQPQAQTEQMPQPQPQPAAPPNVTQSPARAIASNDPQAAQLAAQQNVYGAQTQESAARTQQLASERQAIQAQQGLAPLQLQEVGLLGDWRNAQSAWRTAQLGQNTQETAANAAQTAETQKLQAAQVNAPDLIATAQAQTARNDQAYKYQLAGISQPTEVTLPPGYQGNLPSGVAAKISSQAEITQTQNERTQALRTLALQKGQLGVVPFQLAADQARVQAWIGKLPLKEREIAIQQLQREAQLAGNTAQQAGLGVTNAQIAEGQARLPPEAGMVQYTNPDTGATQWTTPTGAAVLKAHEPVLYTDPVTNVTTQMTRDEANRRDIAYRNGLPNPTPQYSDTALGHLSGSELIQILVHPVPAGPPAPGEAPAVRADEANAELLQRGFTQADIDAMVRTAKAGGSGFGGTEVR